MDSSGISPVWMVTCVVKNLAHDPLIWELRRVSPVALSHATSRTNVGKDPSRFCADKYFWSIPPEICPGSKSWMCFLVGLVEQ